MRPNGQARLTIVTIDYDGSAGSDLADIEPDEQWPEGNDAWRPAVLTRIKRDEPRMGPVSTEGATTVADATIWIADYPELREIVERTGTEICVEFRESRTAPSTFWQLIHARLEFAISHGIALDCCRNTDL